MYLFVRSFVHPPCTYFHTFTDGMTRYKVVFWFQRFKKFQFFNFEATERHLQRKLTRILTNFEKLWFLEMRDSKLTGSSAHVDKRTGITTEWSILEHLFNLGWSKKFESGEIMQFLCTFPIKNTCFFTTLKMGDFCGLGFVVFWVDQSTGLISGLRL